MSAAAAADLAGYEQLLAHAQRELDAAGRGDLAGLEELGRRWRELAAAAPALAGEQARRALRLLEQARATHESTREQLLRLRAELREELSTAQTARRTAAGYGGELAPRPQVDRSV